MLFAPYHMAATPCKHTSDKTCHLHFIKEGTYAAALLHS